MWPYDDIKVLTCSGYIQLSSEPPEAESELPAEKSGSSNSAVQIHYL